MYIAPVAVAADDDGGFDKKGNRRRGCAPKYVLHIKTLRQTGMPEALVTHLKLQQFSSQSFHTVNP